jgi:tetratricopeptide (TPR) repeat protein
MRRQAMALLFVAAAGTAGGEDAAPAGAAMGAVEAALAQARERRVPVLVEFHAPWCYSCYYMSRNVLTGAEWERAQRETVVVGLDADSPEGARWMATWGVKAMPTYLVLDSEGRERGRILGEQRRDEFYEWLFATAGRDSLDALKAAVIDGWDSSLQAAREVLRAYHARYDPAGGLAWLQSLAPKVRAPVSADAGVAAWVARLELQRAAAADDAAACMAAAPAVLRSKLGCERPYELGRVMACTAQVPAAQRRELLKTQVEWMGVLLEKRVFADYRCADERSIVTGAADLHDALGDEAAEKAVLDRAIADVEKRLGADYGSDRTLADNLRVYLERAGRYEELDTVLVKLIAAYPDDYVYAYRHGRSLAARGSHAEALPFFAQADAKAYGVNKLRNAALRAASLKELGRAEEARQVLAEALKANGPWFPEEAAKLKALLDSLPAPAAPAGSKAS